MHACVHRQAAHLSRGDHGDNSVGPHHRHAQRPLILAAKHDVVLPLPLAQIVKADELGLRVVSDCPARHLAAVEESLMMHVIHRWPV